jgi:AraC-like DNA-binding protein
MHAFERTTAFDTVDRQTTVALQPTIAYEYNYHSPLAQVPGIHITAVQLNCTTPLFKIAATDPTVLYFLFCSGADVSLVQEDMPYAVATLYQHRYCILQSATAFTISIPQHTAANCILLQVPVSFALENTLRHKSLLARLNKPEKVQQLTVLFSNIITSNQIQFCLFAMLDPGCNSQYRKIFLEKKAAELLIYTAELLDAVPPTTALEETQLSKEAVLRVRKVISMLEQMPEMHITIIELARQVGTNESYLKKHFKLVTGKTIYAYLLEQRMLLAKQLITKGTTDMQELSRLTGYKRKHHFLEAFKRHFGFVPLSVKTFLLTLYAQLELLVEYELNWLMLA